LGKTKVMEFYLNSSILHVYFDYKSLFIALLFTKSRESLIFRLDGNDKLARILEYF